MVTGLQRQLRAAEQANSTSVGSRYAASWGDCQLCVWLHLAGAGRRAPKTAAGHGRAALRAGFFSGAGEEQDIAGHHKLPGGSHDRASRSGRHTHPFVSGVGGQAQGAAAGTGELILGKSTSPPTPRAPCWLSGQCPRLQAYTAVWSAEREGARHERQLDAESSARSELASTLAQSEHAAQEMGSLLTQQRTVMHNHTLPLYWNDRSRQFIIPTYLGRMCVI